MVGRGDPARAKAALPEVGSSPPDPSTPLRSSERESMAGLLHAYLSEGFCGDCSQVLKERIKKLVSSGALDAVRMPDSTSLKPSPSFYSAQDSAFSCSSESSSSMVSHGSPSNPPAKSGEEPDSSFVIRRGRALNYPSPAGREKAEDGEVSSARAVQADGDDLVDEDKMSGEDRFAWQQREHARFLQVRRKKNFMLMERVEGRMLNVLEGLELHTGVFNSREQEKIVDCVYKLQKLGEARKLLGHTYSRPKKWMRGKGRVTLQFGCCYNYAVDKDGNPPGIVQDEEVDTLPTLFKMMIKRMVRWNVLPPSCIPNSCIVNIYDEGDCIPPHIDHHDFLRPFCTVSFLSECNILFGSNLKVLGPGEFSGPMAIPLPVGSVLILNGNGADVAKHCVPGVPTKRISITFRKMEDSRQPYKFSLDPALQEIKPLQFSPTIHPTKNVSEWNQHRIFPEHQAANTQHGKKESLPLQSKAEEAVSGSNFRLVHDDFPPLGGSNSTRKPSKLKKSD